MKRLSIFFLVLSLTGCDIFMGVINPGFDDAPRVTGVTPNDEQTNVPIGAQVNAVLELPNGGVNLTTVNEQSVRLVDAATGAVVDADATVSNDARSLTLVPTVELGFSTEYRFEITSAVEDEIGEAFEEYSSTFTTVSSDVPSVSRSRPADGERNVAVNTSVATDLTRPIDRNTLTDDSAYLTNLDTGQRVAGNLGTSGGDDTITFTPSQNLEESTEYQFDVTSAVTSQDGVPFLPYTSTFTTGEEGGSGTLPNVEQVIQSAAARMRHSSLTFGPDGNLYATTIIGEIKRYPVGSDGTLGTPETITSLIDDNGGPRLTIGLTFDPASTPDNPIAWVTHTYIDLSKFDGSVDPGIKQYWSGKLTRLSGPNLESVQDVVVGLPRSNKDHVTNSVAFNPAEPGVVYFVQGSNTAMGAPDNAWGPQGERVLAGAVLRLDTNLLGNSLPLDVKTEEGGTYDPFAPNAPLTIYGSGTRNSYDLVWHSNGNLYVPANGSARGGIVPRYNPLPGTCENRIDGRPYTGPMLSDPSDLANYTTTISEGTTDGWVIGETQNDYLFKIEQGGYYGTPNPKRCEWILNGGGGSNSESTDNVPDYPATVEPDPNYRGFTYDFGQNISPNGAIEYRGGAFSGLQGRLLVTRYSTGDDVIALEFDGEGNVVSSALITPAGERQLVDPIDIAEDPNTGYLYVSYYDERSGQAATNAGIALLRPQ